MKKNFLSRIISSHNAGQFSIQLLLFIVGIHIASCSSDREEVFVVENEVEFNIPSGLNTVETHVFVIRNVPTFLAQNLATFGMKTEEIVSIGSGRARLTGVFQNLDYEFIEMISVRARNSDDSNISREMFYREQIPFSQSGDLELLSSISELKDILGRDVFDMEVRIKLRSFVPFAIQSKLIFSYAVFDSEK